MQDDFDRLGPRAMEPRLDSAAPPPLLFESMIRELPVGVMACDERGEIVWFNAAAQRILGLEALGVGPEERARAFGCRQPETFAHLASDRMPLARALQGEVVADLEILLRNEQVPFGAWIRASAAPWRDEERGVSGGVVVFREVTGEKRSLEDTELRSNALEQTADAVLITDIDGVISYVNRGFERMTGYSRAEAVGATPSLLRSGVHDGRFYADLWRTVLGGEVFTGTLVNRRKDGELFHAAQTISPVRGSDGRLAHLVSVLKDITESLRHEHLEIEMEVARQVQQRLYPRGAPRLPGFDLAGAAFPASTMCGDLFDYFPMPGGCVGLAVADVCGHGIGPALLMAQARAYLRCFASSTCDVGEILHRLNETLVVDSDQRDYLTLVLVRLDPRQRTLSYASAGHVTGYLFDRAGEVRERLASTGMPLGLFGGRGYGSSTILSLDPGETLVLTSDGITECGEAAGEAFGAKGLVDFVRGHRAESAESLVAGLHRAALDHCAGSAPTDDMTILICKAEETS